jgi:Mg2+ and Co2+ transporter CorA
MNLVTGLWGMNVWVPGQDQEGNLTWVRPPVICSSASGIRP